MSSRQIANPQIVHHKTERIKHRIFFPPIIAKQCKSWLLICLAKSGKIRDQNHISANCQKYWARKSEIRKLPHLRKVCKSYKFCKSANSRICYLRNLFAVHPPLQICHWLVSTTPAVPAGKFTVSFIPVMYLDANISANF